MQETTGDRPEVVIEAYEQVREQYRRWLKGLKWLETEANWEHPLWAERSEEAMTRARQFGKDGDELADWLQCDTAALLQVLDYDLQQRQGAA